MLILLARTTRGGGSTRDLFLGRSHLRYGAIILREIFGHRFGHHSGRRRRRRRRLGLNILLKGSERGGIGSDESLDASVE